jgi:hypothetical protein
MASAAFREGTPFLFSLMENLTKSIINVASFEIFYTSS